MSALRCGTGEREWMCIADVSRREPRPVRSCERDRPPANDRGNAALHDLYPVTHKDILTLHTCDHTHKHAVHSHSTPHSRMQTVSECERESESVWGYTHVHGVVRSPDAHGGAATRVRTCALPCTHNGTHAQQR